MDIRLYFEPKPGTTVNHNEMFRCYAENYLSDFDFHWGGFISMNALDKVGSAFEPVYQMISKDHTECALELVKDYLTKNPMHGYYTHIYVKRDNENSKHEFVSK